MYLKLIKEKIADKPKLRYIFKTNIVFLSKVTMSSKTRKAKRDSSRLKDTKEN